MWTMLYMSSRNEKNNFVKVALACTILEIGYKMPSNLFMYLELDI